MRVWTHEADYNCRDLTPIGRYARGLGWGAEQR